MKGSWLHTPDQRWASLDGPCLVSDLHSDTIAMEEDLGVYWLTADHDSSMQKKYQGGSSSDEDRCVMPMFDDNTPHRFAKHR